ncbi:class I SAM-dependent methyltransferase [Nonomuraea sp. B19D2]|uniref:class I SAM-dependent methyltransferase n=1 Tax=Nonomuraea sp. B19D2 TaxID=3159561 RepID=UPI0032DA0E30
MTYAHYTGHSDFIRVAAPAIVERLSAAGLGGGHVVDLGCGSGILAGSLIEAGFSVVGVDISLDMLRLAQMNYPGAQYVNASFLDYELPSCVAITAIGQSLGYTLDRRNCSVELNRIFRRVWMALKPGGVFIFDLNTPATKVDHTASDTLWSRRDTAEWTILSKVAVDADHASMTRHITLFRLVDGSYRRTDESHRVLLFEPRKILDLLASTGFVAQQIDGYGGLIFATELAAYVAQKPKT